MSSMPERFSPQHTGLAGSQQIRAFAALQGRYEGQVIALVVQELAVVAPTVGESAVMELVSVVWKQAENHQAAGASTAWSHLSWFVHHAVATRRQGLRTLPLRAAVDRPGATYRMAG
ncbi:hypothetical protein [Kitasatospora indigofera]|uniref:hypothetical protein n=1 Tax=Kitasatospora indigofera TaxID=67307 RepID=UPI0036C16BA2